MNAVGPSDATSGDADVKAAGNGGETNGAPVHAKPGLFPAPAAAADTEAPVAPAAVAQTAAADSAAVASESTASAAPVASGGSGQQAGLSLTAGTEAQGPLGTVAGWRLGWRRTCHTMAQALGLKRLQDYIQVLSRVGVHAFGRLVLLSPADKDGHVLPLPIDLCSSLHHAATCRSFHMSLYDSLPMPRANLLFVPHLQGAGTELSPDSPVWILGVEHRPRALFAAAHDAASQSQVRSLGWGFFQWS